MGRLKLWREISDDDFGRSYFDVSVRGLIPNETYELMIVPNTMDDCMLAEKETGLAYLNMFNTSETGELWG